MAEICIARDRLLVGDDRECFERGSRQARGLAFEHESFDVRREIGMALEPPTAGDLDENEASLLEELGGHLAQECFHLLDGCLGDLREQLGLDWLVGHHQNGLDGASCFVSHQPS